jgi:Ca2+-binding RTX toxin-like protein
MIAVLLLAAPTTASAASLVSVEDKGLADVGVIMKGDEAANQVTASIAKTGTKTWAITVHDDASPLLNGEDCVLVDAQTVTCTTPRASLGVSLGAGDDRIGYLSSAEWINIEAAGGDGNDTIDLTGVNAPSPVNGGTFVRGTGARAAGGRGNDVLIGGSGDDFLDGNQDDDDLRGGAGKDFVTGNDGADKILGEAGKDSLNVRPSDAVIDGGTENDYIDFGKDSRGGTVTCGDGEDYVDTHYDHEPGPLLGADCEDGGDFLVNPVKATKTALTFKVRCSDGFKCKSPLELRFKDKLVATTTFGDPKHRFKLVTLALPRKLQKAIAAGPVELALAIRHFKYEEDEFSSPEIVDVFWRLNYDASAAAAGAPAGTAVDVGKGGVTVTGDETASAMTATIARNAAGALAVAIHDDAATLVAGPGCIAAGEHDVSCATPKPNLVADLGAGDDVFAFGPASVQAKWRSLKVAGGEGNDRLDSRTVLYDEDNEVALEGGAGNDVLVSDKQSATLDGGDGDDQLTSSRGADTVIGGPGADTISTGRYFDQVTAGAGDVVHTGGSLDEITVTDGSPELFCGPESDDIRLPGNDAPGPVLDSDCENVDVSRAQPVKVKADTLVFEVGCSILDPRCHSVLHVSRDGKEIGRAPFSSEAFDGYSVRVPVKVGRPLVRAIRREPQLLAFKIERYHEEDDRGRFVTSDRFWQARVGA